MQSISQELQEMIERGRQAAEERKRQEMPTPAEPDPEAQPEADAIESAAELLNWLADPFNGQIWPETWGN